MNVYLPFDRWYTLKDCLSRSLEAQIAICSACFATLRPLFNSESRKTHQARELKSESKRELNSSEPSESRGLNGPGGDRGLDAVVNHIGDDDMSIDRLSETRKATGTETSV